MPENDNNINPFQCEAQVVPLRRSLASETLTAAWSPPPDGVIKINIDAVFSENSSSCWVSMVDDDSLGSCLWWSWKNIVGRPRPVDGEALAIHHGLSVARDRGWTRILVESDCLQLVLVLSKGSSSFTSFGAIVDAFALAFIFRFFSSLFRFSLFVARATC